MSETYRDRSEPTDDRDFQQFARAFDRPVAPAPSFAESLRQQVIQSSAAAISDRQIINAPLTAGESRVVTLAERRPHRVGFSILEIAAALLLISAVALSAYAINTVGRPIGPDGGNGPGRLSQRIASPAADLQAINWGGDSGRTWYFGDAEIGTSTPPLDVRVDDFDTRTVGPGLVVGDSWYGWTFRAGADVFLRVDVQTGQQVWERVYRTWGTLASDGQRIFAFLIDDSDTPTPIPVAIDMTTGEIAWRGPALHPFATQVTFENEANAVFNLDGPPIEVETYYIDMTSEEQGPVVVGETVYFADGAGTTIALDTNDGSERWRYDRSADFAGYSGDIEPPSGGTIVANDEYLFVILPDRSIARLAPATGREIDHLVTVDPYFRDRHMTGLSLRGDSLIATTASSFVGSGSQFAALLVMDAETFEVTASTDITELSFARSLVVTDTSAYIRAEDETGGMKLYEVSLATGQMSEGFGGDLPTGEVRLSGVGDTLIATASTGTVFYFSMESPELIESYRVTEPGPVTLAGGPVQVVDGHPIVIWKAGPNDPVPQMPEATPTP